MKIQVGDLVTCKYPVEAYYSGRAGNPIVNFHPGHIGVVKSVKVPCVYAERGFKTFTRVEFLWQESQSFTVCPHDPDLESGFWYPPFCDIHPHCDLEVWNCALLPDNIQKIKGANHGS